MFCNPHPDADAVGAYLEGGLSARDRRGLEAHLSTCAPCRELAACAGVALQAQTRAHCEPGHWLWQAPLALAASAILVAGAVWWVRPPAARHTATEPQAVSQTNPPQLAPAQPRVAGAPVPAAPPMVWAKLAGPPPALTRPAQPTAPAAQPAAAFDFASLRAGFRDQAVPARTSSSLVDWGGVTGAQPILSGTQATLVVVPPLEAALPSVSPASAFPLAASFASSSSAAVPAPDSPQLAAELGWAISRSGALLKAVTAGFWHTVPFVPGVEVHVIYVREGHVWAGGDANELYTSIDRGKHWQRVSLPGLPPHRVLLRSIVFLDAQHGLITAANGQSWSTSDAGRTWVPR